MCMCDFYVMMRWQVVHGHECRECRHKLNRADGLTHHGRAKYVRLHHVVK